MKISEQTYSNIWPSATLTLHRFFGLHGERDNIVNVDPTKIRGE